MITIRDESPADYYTTEEIVRKAFAGVAESDGSEPALVSRLRKEPTFMPSLSLVAELNGRIVGHILFTPIEIIEAHGTSHRSLALAPVSVLPTHQKQGIGAALIREGHGRSIELGYTSVVLAGHPAYYPRFGYVPASRWGITAPFPIPDEAFMALELTPGSLEGVSGQVRYPPAFGIS